MNDFFLSGNEALAHACLKNDVKIATGYPGTPSTEIIQTLKKLGGETQAFWSSNEKIALETALGACFTGARTMAVMKHVGLNVASDPFMTASYTGVKGGFVVVSCDDPNMYSSQNEQDNRHYAPFAKIPMLEPSDSQESYDFLRHAFHLSEAYDTPVLLRMTTRVCHSKSLVCITEDQNLNPLKISFENQQEKFIMLPAYGRKRHYFVEERIKRLQDFSSKIKINVFEKGEGDILYITSGVSYHYLKEVLPKVPILKLGMSYPLPIKKIKKLSLSFSKIVCVEELDPFLEMRLLAEGFCVQKRNDSFYCGELSPKRVLSLITDNEEKEEAFVFDSQNPPSLCSGCPHLTISILLRDLNLRVCGDIGCYTLGAQAPFNAIGSVVDMGASIAMMVGMNKVLPKEEKKRTVAVIGDSTFLHSGISALIDAVYQSDLGVVCLLNNDATAMTGRQSHPGSLQQETGKHQKVNYSKLALSLGVKYLHQVDPYDFQACKTILQKALKEEGLSLIIFNRACALISPKKKLIAETKDSCVRCGECLAVGCPSISFDLNRKRPIIDEYSCTGCRICFDVCDHQSIVMKDKS